MPNPSPSGSGLRHVRVAALPIAETAALWGGISAGIFTRHGLDVEVLPAQGGALAIPALTNGDLDFAIGQPFGPFRADLQDLGVAIIGNYASSYATGDDINAVVASKASGITRPRELAGRKVSVNSLGAAGSRVEKDEAEVVRPVGEFPGVGQATLVGERRRELGGGKYVWRGVVAVLAENRGERNGEHADGGESEGSDGSAAHRHLGWPDRRL